MIEYKGYRAIHSDFTQDVSILNIDTGKALAFIPQEHLLLNYAKYLRIPTPEAYEIIALALFIATREILKESVNALRSV